MVTAKDIHHLYGNLEVLRGVDLSVEKGEVVSIVGASGAGKTTLLQILGTLEEPVQGWVEIADTDVGSLGNKALAAFRNRHLGFVFQFHHLLPEFTALENICIPAFIGEKDPEKAESRGRELLAMLGIEARSDHKPAQLSGGEQQRVAVARALMNDPHVVLADEPSGNLDSTNSRELHRLFFELREKLGQTFVIATHNEALAEMSDRQLVMEDGVLTKAR